jgi:hypothetical protein
MAGNARGSFPDRACRVMRRYSLFIYPGVARAAYRAGNFRELSLRKTFSRCFNKIVGELLVFCAHHLYICPEIHISSKTGKYDAHTTRRKDKKNNPDNGYRLHRGHARRVLRARPRQQQRVHFTNQD